MLYVPNIHFGVQYSFTFFLNENDLRRVSIRPPLPIFGGGGGVKNVWGGWGVQTLMFVDLFQNNAHLGSDIILV